VLENTPPIPDGAQWGLFLRNHDELTLEMVTDEERDYMYRMYAHVRQARLNLGIRRRLAPLRATWYSGTKPKPTLSTLTMTACSPISTIRTPTAR